MVILAILMSIMVATMVYSIGTMVIPDIIDMICFNPSNLTFKDKGKAWEFTECERKRYHGIDGLCHQRFNKALFTKCHHKGIHNLTMSYESKMWNTSSYVLALAKARTENSWAWYRILKDKDDDRNPFKTKGLWEGVVK